jgi:hypothetical protein
MRIRSIHPRYLDSKWLVALRRETLLAKHVLEWKTIWYKQHPQLDRFKAVSSPLGSINQYLSVIFDEATSRGYTFSKEKIDWEFIPTNLSVTEGQLAYERTHLLHKLKNRDLARYNLYIKEEIFECNPMFEVVSGDVESWEVIK